MFHVPEQYRKTEGNHSSKKEDGNNGVFFLPIKRGPMHLLKGWLQVIASDGLGWEHVSVCVISFDKKKVVERTPSWDEMNHVKDMFWGASDTVIQFHPKKSSYVNKHPFVLHLWKRIGSDYDLPLSIMV